MPQTPTLSRIRIYPVKSLGGFDRDVWELDAFGLRYDRRWMIVDPDGRFMTQRDYPGMAEIAVEMQADRLILSASMRSPIAVPLEPEPGASEPVSIWGDTVAARAVSEDANRWLGEVLQTPCRLVYMPEESARTVNPKYVDRAAQVSFADGFPLLLTSEESLEELNRRLPEPVTMDRFRPNLVVRGTSGPHAEDAWRRIRLSDMELHVVKPCARCVIVTTDQDTGERGVEPLQTLATYRSANGEVYFGQNVVHVGYGRVRVGDEVHILETGDPVPDLDGEASGDSAASAGEPETASEPEEHSAQAGTESAEPSFEIYLPESDEDLEFEPNLPAEPERKIERYIPAQPGGRKASREADTESDAAGEPAGTPVDDIIFPFEVDLVVTPEDLKEAAMKQAAAEAEAVEEEAAEEEAAEEEAAEEEAAEEEAVEEEAAEEETVEAEAIDVDSVEAAVEDDAMEAEGVAEAAAEEVIGEAAAEDEGGEDEPVEDEPVDDELMADEPLEDEPVEDELATEEPGDEAADLPEAGEAAGADEDVVEGIALEEEVPEGPDDEVIDEAVEEEALEDTGEAGEAPAEVSDEDLEVEEPAVAEAAGKAKAKSKSRRRAAREIEFALGGRPDAATINRLYEAAGRPEVAGDQDPGRIDRAFEASNVVVAAWLGDTLVGVLRGWSDGARDGFIADLVVHPDHVGAGIGVELVHHAMDAHPGIRWVLRASVTSPYLGNALGWTHLGGGWFVSPA